MTCLFGGWHHHRPIVPVSCSQTILDDDGLNIREREGSIVVAGSSTGIKLGVRNLHFCHKIATGSCDTGCSTIASESNVFEDRERESVSEFTIRVEVDLCG